jgi:MFS family permease
MNRDTAGVISIAFLYFIGTFYYGNWFASIPVIETNRGISNGRLGDYISIAVIGAILAMWLVPIIHNLIGSAVTTFLSIIFLAIAFCVIGIIGSDYIFGIGFVLYGFAINIMYASNNKQSGLLEKSTSRLSTGIFVASQSAGGILGGIIGGCIFDYTSLSVFYEMIIVSIVMIIFMFLRQVARLNGERG